MKKFILDTNALISYVTDRNIPQQEIIAPYIEAASRMKCSLICHQFVLSEFVFVMDKVYGTPKQTINSILQNLIELPGVEIFQQTDFKVVLSLWPSLITDFGDSLIAATAKSVKGATVITFDEKFKTALNKLGIRSV